MLSLVRGFSLTGHRIGKMMTRSRMSLLLASVLGLLLLLQPVALAAGITVFVTVVPSENDSGDADALVVGWTSGVYLNNLDITQKLEIPHAAALQVTAVGSTEVGYDWLHIYDSEGKEIRRFSGKIDAVFTAQGSFIWVRFVTDGSVTDRGVSVSVRPAEVD